MQFTMTLRQALAIQDEQIKWYAHHHPQGEEGLRADVKAKTGDLTGRNLDAAMEVWEVNRLVPRGAAIEYMLGLDFGGD